MKKLFLFTVGLFVLAGLAVANHNYCFLTSCGEGACLTTTKELSMDMQLAIYDSLEMDFCGVMPWD